MGSVFSIRDIDLISASRHWPSANRAYFSRGLTVGTFSSDPDPVDISSEARLQAMEATLAMTSAVEQHEDGVAIHWLDAAWEQVPGETLMAVVASIMKRKIALDRLEKALPMLAGDPNRITKYLLWLDAAPPLNLSKCLCDEAAKMTAVHLKYRRGTRWIARACQGRTMTAWAKVYDESQGFQASPEAIAQRLEETAEEPGISRHMIALLFPVLAQSLRSASKLAEIQQATRNRFSDALSA